VIWGWGEDVEGGIVSLCLLCFKLGDGCVAGGPAPGAARFLEDSQRECIGSGVYWRLQVTACPQVFWVEKGVVEFDTFLHGVLRRIVVVNGRGFGPFRRTLLHCPCLLGDWGFHGVPSGATCLLGVRAPVPRLAGQYALRYGSGGSPTAYGCGGKGCLLQTHSCGA
jgi:hypothetical protein